MRSRTIDLESLYSIMLNDRTCEYLLTIKNSDRFSRKIPCSDMAVILDWDDTLTEPGINNNSWQIMNNAFSKVGETKNNLLLEKIVKKYHEIEKQRPLTSKEMKEWQRTNLGIYTDGNLDLRCLEKEIQKSRMYLSGAILLVYLLENCSNVCIVSSGVRNVIEKTLEYYGIDPKKYGNLQINATEVSFDEKGIISGWEDNSIVTAEKKPWIVHSFSRIWDIPHENIFAVGDGNTDLNMLDLVSDGATMIFFCPSHKKDVLTRKKFELVSSKAHGFVKNNFGIITNFFIQTSEA